MSVDHGTDAATTNCLRVLIYDDYEVFRVGLQVVLQSVAELIIVGAAETPAEVIAMSGDLEPDVVLVSTDLRPEAITLIDTLRRAGGRIISISHGPVERGTSAALVAGASMHLAEPVAADQLIEAVRGAARGDIKPGPDAAVNLLARLESADLNRLI